mmetsp:Transcript_67645/g.78542  ORF Transcript_67645/g.78542 Transcript_67645/m.78542 type:complete len:248 (-) Transcript_67645:182-925(-)
MLQIVGRQCELVTDHLCLRFALQVVFGLYFLERLHHCVSFRQVPCLQQRFPFRATQFLRNLRLRAYSRVPSAFQERPHNVNMVVESGTPHGRSSVLPLDIWIATLVKKKPHGVDHAIHCCFSQRVIPLLIFALQIDPLTDEFLHFRNVPLKRRHTKRLKESPSLLLFGLCFLFDLPSFFAKLPFPTRVRENTVFRFLGEFLTQIFLMRSSKWDSLVISTTDLLKKLHGGLRTEGRSCVTCAGTGGVI